MSGFEVAGIALGVFPIAAKGLQQLSDAVRTWRRYQRELDNYSRSLETQRLIYQNTIALLLDGIVDSNDELDKAKAEPSRALVQHQKRLQSRLGDSYHTYERIEESILKALTGLREELGADEEGNV